MTGIKSAKGSPGKGSTKSSGISKDGALQTSENFVLATSDWNAFVNALKNPPEAVTELKKLLAEKAPWEK